MARPRRIAPLEGEAPPSKRDCIMMAARQVFLEMGYAAASMDAVAARANVSKATIYAHFDNKRALFEHIIGATCETVFAVLDTSEHCADAASALRRVAVNFVALMLSDEVVAINRAVVAEAARLPEVGEAFYGAGPNAGLERVTRLFNELTRRGLLSIPPDDAPLAAELFIGMLKGDVHLRALVGLPPRRRDNSRLIDLAVELILTRYGTMPANSGRRLSS